MGDYFCILCGLPTKKSCGNCGIEYYCGRECQKAAWNAGHKEKCKKPAATTDTVKVASAKPTQSSTGEEVASITGEEVASIIASLNLNEQNESRRMQICHNFSWALPSQDVIDSLFALFREKGKILSVGAGRGLWERLLEEAGLDVTATDAFKSHGIETDGKTYTHVYRMDHLTAIASFPEATTLLLCWPTFKDPFAFEALERFRGDYLIYIGEGEGGCTANDSFFDLLDKEWNQTKFIDILSWRNIYDSIQIYERKSKAS